ncbi:MAG: hypothetical protein KGQ66_19375 [Acidobacteriota bacterium]|nr:hypothetical protein [Acidobacteriota bacterium]
METVEHSSVASRRPSALDLVAAAGLVATVVLHVVAMAPTYFVGTGSLMSQPDQATIYAVVAAAWALALVIGLTGPNRTPVAAALAVGVAATELGFRVADLGDALRYGTQTVGSGLWLMEAAWVVGAVAAGLAVAAARSRHTPGTPRRSEGADAPEPWSGLQPGPAAYGPDPAGAAAYGPDLAGADTPDSIDWTAPIAAGDARPEPDLASVPVAVAVGATGGATEEPGVPRAAEDDHERAAWTLLVIILAAVTAGAFLPAWDHAVATSSVTGRSVGVDLGNAFSHQPWQQVVGTVLAAVSLLVVPAVAVRLRNKAVGAAAVCGSLLVLAAQLASAVVQVDQPVSPSYFGLTAGQVQQLGLSLSLRLTVWFTVDALAAYALLAAVMVWSTLRVAHDNSAGTVPRAPFERNEAMPSAS